MAGAHFSLECPVRLHLLVTVVVALLLAYFAACNWASVVVTFWPFFQFDAPLFAVVLAGMLGGFLVGELVAWAGGRRGRRQARQATRRVEALERELAAAQAQLRSETGTAGGLPIAGTTR